MKEFRFAISQEAEEPTPGSPPNVVRGARWARICTARLGMFSDALGLDQNVNKHECGPAP